MSSMFSTAATHTVFSRSWPSEAVRLNDAKLKPWPSAKVSALSTHSATLSDLLKNARELKGGRRGALAHSPPSRRLSVTFSSAFRTGLCHKPVALSKGSSKELYQGLSDRRAGTWPAPQSLGSRNCAGSSLLSHLCRQSPYPSDFEQEKKHSQAERIWKFSAYLSEKWPRLCSPNCKKVCKENAHQCVSFMGSVYLFILDLPSQLPWPHVGQPFGSFLQAEPSVLSAQLSVSQANSHLFRASFLLCASFILLAFLSLPVAP